jgi:hypothetical protein
VTTKRLTLHDMNADCPTWQRALAFLPLLKTVIFFSVGA